jgi:ATP-dependent Clp protease protease subunit
MTKRTPMIFASADREAIRAKWSTQFQNRTVKDAKPGKLEVKNATGDVAEIMVYDEIGFWGVTASDFVAELKNVTAPKVVVRINSPGGDVFDGLAIFAAIQGYAGDVTCVVDGWAASAASFIALAGKETTMAPNAFMMIHKAWALAIGNADDMSDMKDTLDKLDGQLAQIYAKKTGKSADEMMTLMAGKVDGTWFTAQEALGLGLIDEIAGADEEESTDDETAENARRVRISNMRRRLALAEVEA